MDPNLNTNEMKLVAYLQDRGLSLNAARIYALAISRQYKAPEEILADILAFFVGLQDLERDVLLTEVDNLVKRGLLQRSQTPGGDTYLEAREPISAISAALLDGVAVDQQIVDLIAEKIRSFQPGSRLDTAFAERVTWATWPQARDALNRAIGEAVATIRLGMFSSSSVYAQLNQDIRDALTRKVHVQLLMFAPDLALRVEHSPKVKRDIQERVRAWKKLYKSLCREKGRNQVGKFEIRLISDERMLAVHRSLLVDDKMWILNIHRPSIDRGVEGLVYRGSCQEGETTIYSLLDYYWDSAWDRAIATDFFGRLSGLFDSYGKVFIAIVLAGIAWYLQAIVKSTNLTNIFLGATLAKSIDAIPQLRKILEHILIALAELFVALAKLIGARTRR